VERPRGKPPSVTSSNPRTPVGHFSNTPSFLGFLGMCLLFEHVPLAERRAARVEIM